MLSNSENITPNLIYLSSLNLFLDDQNRATLCFGRVGAGKSVMHRKIIKEFKSFLRSESEKGTAKKQGYLEKKNRR